MAVKESLRRQYSNKDRIEDYKETRLVCILERVSKQEETRAVMQT